MDTTTTIKTNYNALHNERVTLTYSLISEMYRITVTTARGVATELFSNIKQAVTTYQSLTK